MDSRCWQRSELPGKRKLPPIVHNSYAYLLQQRLFRSFTKNVAHIEARPELKPANAIHDFEGEAIIGREVFYFAGRVTDAQKRLDTEVRAKRAFPAKHAAPAESGQLRFIDDGT